MASADKDGRIAQWLNDQLVCLSMEMHESIAEATVALEEALAEVPGGDHA